MKLYYFAGAGRAEVMRIMFKVSGTEFEDVRFNSDEWRDRYKAISPTGQAPFLELDDGTIICQSMAISIYVAQVTKLAPADLVARVRTIEMMACLEEVSAPLMSTWSLPAGEEKTNARKALIAPGGAMHKALATVDKLLGASKTEFYLEDRPTLADFAVFVGASSFGSGMLDGITKEDIQQFKNLWSIRTKVANHGPIKEMYANVDDRAAFKP